MTRDEFKAMLDAFGGERRRWPADRRASAEQFLREDAGAGQLYQQARALDQVLAAAPTVGRETESRLADRIFRAAVGQQESPGVVTSPARRSADVIDFNRHRRNQPAKTATGSPHLRQAAMALAASLMLGIMFGASDWSRTALEPLARATGLNATSELETSIAELHEGTESGLEEELL